MDKTSKNLRSVGRFYISIYLASYWGNAEQMRTMCTLRNILFGMGHDVFAPYFDAGVLTKENDSSEKRKEIYLKNIEAIQRSDLVVAVIDDFDPGVIFEFGYAVGWAGANCAGAPKILAYSDVPGRGLNVMLRIPAWGFANGIDQLRYQIYRFSHGMGSYDFVEFEKGDVS